MEPENKNDWAYDDILYPPNLYFQLSVVPQQESKRIFMALIVHGPCGRIWIWLARPLVLADRRRRNVYINRRASSKVDSRPLLFVVGWHFLARLSSCTCRSFRYCSILLAIKARYWDSEWIFARRQWLNTFRFFFANRISVKRWWMMITAIQLASLWYLWYSQVWTGGGGQFDRVVLMEACPPLADAARRNIKRNGAVTWSKTREVGMLTRKNMESLMKPKPQGCYVLVVVV